MFDSHAGQLRHSFVTDAIFFRSCFAQALWRVDWFPPSLYTLRCDTVSIMMNCYHRNSLVNEMLFGEYHVQKVRY